MPIIIKWGQDRDKVFLTFDHGKSIGKDNILKSKYYFNENNSFVYEYNDEKFILNFYGNINNDKPLDIFSNDNLQRYILIKKEKNLFWKFLLKDKLAYNNLISVDWNRWQYDDSSDDDINPLDFTNEDDINTEYLDMMRNMSPEQLQEMMGNMVDDDTEDDNDEKLDIDVPNDIDPEKLKEIMESVKGNVPDNTEGIKEMLEKMGATSIPGMPGMGGKSDFPGIPNLDDLPNLDE